MTKDRKKKDRAKDSAKTRNKDKGKSRNDGKDRGQQFAGAAEIAKAERRLAEALTGVEDARAELARRERELTALLQKHDRLPQESVTLIDQQQVVSDVNAAVIHEGQAPDVDAARLFNEPVDAIGQRRGDG